MKITNRTLLVIGGIFAARALARWGGADIGTIVLSLSALGILYFGICIYKKTRNWLFLLGCILLVTCFPFLGVLESNATSSHVIFWEISGILLFVFCLAFGCMITGGHQIAPHIISCRQWKYWLIGLSGSWLVYCGGLAALTFLWEYGCKGENCNNRHNKFMWKAV